MPLHIGIVAISAEGASLCYKTICSEGSAYLGPYGHPEISMHTLPLDQYVKLLEKGDNAGVATLMLASANKLASIGADFLICPCNTTHEALPYLQENSPLPWLHIADVVADEAQRRGFHRLGLLGSRWLVQSDVYPSKLAERGIKYLRPTVKQMEEIHHIILDELVYGIFEQPGIEYFQSVIRSLKDSGCDAVVLGCTEIPLIISDINSVLPTLDSTRLLARAALSKSVGADQVFDKEHS